MTDDQLIERLRSTTPADVAPPAGFADVLFEQLVLVAGLRPRRGWALSGATLRFALLIVLAALILVAGALAGSRLLGPRPEDLVERSRALYLRPPAFDAVVVSSEGERRRVRTDGRGTWRVDVEQSAERKDGQAEIWAADGIAAEWDPGDGSWRSSPAAAQPPFPLQTEIAWSTGGSPGSMTCASWVDVGVETVADRRASHLRCAERDQDFWIDRDSLLVLRVQAGTATPGWTPGAGIAMSDLRVAPTDPADFVPSPEADHPEGWPSELVVGEPIPAWSGVTLDGGRVGSDRALGRPQVMLVWGSWCPPCTEQALSAFDGLASRTDVDLVSIAIADQPSAVRAALGAAGADVSTVVDDGTIKTAFGASAVPVFVLVDSPGIVRAVAVGPVDPGRLADAVETLVAGGTPDLS